NPPPTRGRRVGALPRRGGGELAPSPDAGEASWRLSPDAGEASWVARSALRVLRSFPGSFQPVFLALLLARVARQEPGFLEGRPEVRIGVQERPGDAVRDGPRLAGNAAPDHLHGGVEPAHLGDPERRQHLHLEDSPA